ncbi:penicillin-insensitive murein endopeptidase [Mesobaculum littorinae]|uniref:Penicillin-insensitive murein endopeptidase n=1 Tax=Mesobaculum littorinae TaxID=2486419 RepID=A0A438AHN9_9RHOB|nr:penicillin-insensitive murein endopeptidase [Mesobaculum littorinae]RVV98145.1 penicillin-insensitive murein endopeptidase [Mesobaculum littorinae]
MIRHFLPALLLALAACGGGDTAPPLAPSDVTVLRTGDPKRLFSAETTGSPQSPQPYGSYSKGCMAGGVQLAETGPTWQAMRLSRNRNWALPETVDFVQDLSRKAAAIPGYNGIYVGDMSQPRGGPMSSGHASHQVGLDADIWLMPATLGLSRTDRENLSAQSYRRAAGAYTNDRWGPSQMALVKAAAQDPRVARIFIFPGAKVAMCNAERGDRSWLRKVRPWGGHHYHFHIRLNCPPGATACVDQDPPPPGDGCADAQDWVNNILNPPPRDPNAPAPRPSRPVTMSDLPRQCSAVLSPA